MGKRRSAPRRQISLRLPEHILQPLEGVAEQSGLSVNEHLTRMMAEFVGAGNHPTKLRKVAPADTGTTPSHVKYFYCLPCPAVVSDLDSGTICANEAFERLVGHEVLPGSKPPMHWVRSEIPVADWILKHDQIVRSTQQPIFCRERILERHAIRDKLALRFPLFQSPEKCETSPERSRKPDASGTLKGVGAILFDFEALEGAAALKPEKETSRLRTDGKPTYPLDLDQERQSALQWFVHSVPGIATVKDFNGFLVCVNDLYERVTGKKRRDVIGKRPFENWPPATARTIADHDLVVRETRAPFLSVETLEIGPKGVEKERLNLRFPIFSPSGEIVMTGTLGFDYALLSNALQQLGSAPIEDVYTFAPEDPQSIHPLKRD